MTIKRREFLKATAAGGALMVAGSQSASASTGGEHIPPKAVGILYDSNLCIGCQACMTACKDANDMPPEHSGTNTTWDNPLDLSAKTLNVIKMYRDGDNYAFIKRHCQHCLDPACVNACPVSALVKNRETGVVTYDASACIGCRYCQVACPYNVPKFEWNSPFPKIQKCQLCDHLFEQGRYSACCESCPTGASLFGPVEQLKMEAERRLQMEPGKQYDFPVNNIENGETRRHKAEHYINHIYGSDEVGGSQYLILSGTDFSKLGLPDLRERSYVKDLEGIANTFYKYLIYPVAAFAGLAYLAKKRDHHE
jgi:Fe-S-cluster-containing dehydrogenase component